jgi:phage terminase large subunit-like protein
LKPPPSTAPARSRTRSSTANTAGGRPRKSRPPPRGPYWFDDREAARAELFFGRFLTFVEGAKAGETFKLEPWQREIVRAIFGWKRAADNTRRYRRAYIEVPRKNGKSPLAAGIALKCLFADGELAPLVVSAAADRDQAAIVFDAARQMILAAPELAARSQVMKRAVVVGIPGRPPGVYRVLSSDVRTKHGLGPSAVIFDELHAQPNRQLWDVLVTGTAARRQPLVVAITTAGDSKHSICWELHDYAVKVRDGVIDDPEFLPVIYAADPEDDWRSPETWAKANPNLGVSVQPDYLLAECRRAEASADYENTFKRLHLNLWTEQTVRYIPMHAWDACAKLPPPADAAPLAPRPARQWTGGLDLATVRDMASLAWVSPPVDGDPVWRVRMRYWMPEHGIEGRELRDRLPYRRWAREGHLELTPGNVIDYAWIRARILEDSAKLLPAELAFDPWNATQLSTELAEAGLVMVPFTQGFKSYTEPLRRVLTLVLSGELAHDGHEVLRMNAQNLATVTDPAGNVKPAKDRSGGAIDGLVALTMAVGRAMLAPGPSVYETRGVESF